MMVRRWAPVAVWAAVILLSTSIPGPALPPGPAGSDKVGHFLMYGVLGLLSIRAALAQGGDWRRITAVCLSAIAAFAAIDEWHQGLVPGRFPEVADWIADMAGATVGAGTTAFLTLRRAPRS